ncbi:hypothetical protein D3C78_1566890 [compost metagenome]
MGSLQRQRQGFRIRFRSAAGPPKGFEDVDTQRAQFLDPLLARLRQVDVPLTEGARRVIAQ